MNVLCLFVKRCILSVVVMLSGISIAVYADSMSEILEQSGVSGGVIVQLGCGGGKSIVGLHSDDKVLVYGLDTNATTVDKAKEYVASKKIYGQVSAEKYDGINLPFGDNIVNLLIIEDPAKVSVKEIERVLVPRGVLFIKDKTVLAFNNTIFTPAPAPDGWFAYKKNVPSDIDDWPHFLYGASNNAVSKDKKIGKPCHVQWFAGPEHTRDHDALASMSAMTSSGGRVFYIYDEGPVSLIHQPADWKLIARDAFNGKLLWKRKIPDWMTHLYNFRAGPVQLPRRLVSIGDNVYVTLGFEAPVQKLDAATGQTLMTYKNSEKTEELICDNGVLLVAKGDPHFLIGKADGCVGFWELFENEKPTIAKQIIAYDSESGKQKWRLDQENLKSIIPLSLCAQDGKVFYLDSKQLHCLNEKDGKEEWSSPLAIEGLFIRSYAPTVVVHNDVIMCLLYNKFLGYSLETGKKLWEIDKGAVGMGSPGDLFVIDDKAWIMAMHKGMVRKQESVFPAKTVEAVDIHTGEIVNSLPLIDDQHHHRCFRDKATEKNIIMGYSGIQLFDLKKGTTDINQWVRGLCQYGMMLANGYIYVPPDPCKCYGDVKINGFYTLSEKNSLDNIDVVPVLEKGPAYGLAKKESQVINDSSSWKTFRGDVERSGGTDSSLPEKLSVKWSSEVGKSLTASVIAYGSVYVAQKDAYTLYCLNALNGEELWRYMANGPVDTPPTIQGELCVFGCGDGSVYCLNAKDGALVWRFKVSELERRIGSENRLESPWHINGAVLIQDDTVYFSAGRSSHLDGGIKLYGLDLVTGKTRYFTEIKSDVNENGLNLYSKQAQKTLRQGALSDIIIAKDSRIIMRGLSFDSKLQKQKGNTSWREMIDSSWFHRQAGVGGGQGQFFVKNNTGTYTIVNTYTGLKQRRKVKTTSQVANKWNQVGHFHQKYTRYLQKDWFPIGVWIESQHWKIDEALQPRAAVVAGDRLYMAGWIDSMDIELKTGVPDKKVKPRVSVLRVYSTKDGSRIAEYKLDSEPVWESAAVSNGNLFLSLKSGKLICMGD